MINTTPVVTKDARFIGARKLVERGQVEKGAVDMLRVLISRAEEEFGESSLNTAAVYYEYGSALFLRVSKDVDGVVISDDIRDLIEDSLEYMAKSCSILYLQSEELKNKKPLVQSQDIKITDYYGWIHEQLPRNLIGIGRILSFQGNHGESVESFMNAIPFLEKMFETFEEKSDPAYLRAHRLLIEGYVQVAEELLMCPEGQDIALNHDNTLIIKSSERVPQARFYYDKSREGLQEVVFSMAKMEQEKKLPISEKEDICYLATMLMHVGMSLTHAEDTVSDVNNGNVLSCTNPTKKRKL